MLERDQDEEIDGKVCIQQEERAADIRNEHEPEEEDHKYTSVKCPDILS